MKRVGTGRCRRIAVITGTRAEYGLLTSTMEAIRSRRDLALQLVVTGMHLLKRFGRTADQIRADGWTIDARIPMQRGDDSPTDQAEGLARGVAGIARYLASAQSDVVLVLGDRIEAMAGALAAVTTGRILAHVHGGDVAAGDFDDSLRHAITKLAQVHFTASRAAQKRVIALGEDSRRVYCVGAPGLDRLRELKAVGGSVVKDGRSALIVQHPIGRSAAEERAVMKRILDAADQCDLRGTIIMPNSDRGYTGIAAAIEGHQRGTRGGAWNVVATLPRDEYLRRLIDADVLIGNSSSGIIEAGVAGVAVVDVGSRQAGREVDGRRVIHCAESAAGMLGALRVALRPRVTGRRGSVYGNEPVGPKIAEILAGLRIDESLRRKTPLGR